MNSSVGKPNIKRDAFNKDSLRTDFNKQLQFELSKLRSLIINSGGAYTLPIASDTILGGIKVGSGLSIDINGILSSSYAYTLPIASDTILGGIKVGAGLSIDGSGVLTTTGPASDELVKLS